MSEEIEGVAQAPPKGSGLSDPERWVEEHGDNLFKFAMARVRDAARAEDLVQETFLAALKAQGSFAGRSAEKSWLTGILRNKIFDYFRKTSRETAFTDLEFFADEEGSRFSDGTWLPEGAPVEWPEAGAALDQAAFWKAYRACAGKLPKNINAVFSLREIDGIGSREICALLNVSESNLWVMLHRARMALRLCLEKNWFGKE